MFVGTTLGKIFSSPRCLMESDSDKREIGAGISPPRDGGGRGVLSEHSRKRIALYTL